MGLLDHKPALSPENAAALVRELYDIPATAAPLPGERDQNFLIQAESSERFVLKIANALEDRSILEAQNQAMRHVAQHVSVCPRVVPTTTGDSIAEIRSPAGAKHWARLVTHLPGVPLAMQRRHSAELLQDLGRCVGQLDRALSGFDHPAAHRDLHWDLANGLQVVNGYKSLITDVELRELVDRFVLDFEGHVAPVLQRLRRSVIHNDANDYNVIVGGGASLYTRNQKVVGLIDFGDLVYSYTVGDLAIAIAYAILDKPDPLAAAAEVTRGYHAENPLTEDEIAALVGLVCMRLCASVCLAAHQQVQRAEDAYLTISQRPIRDALPRLARIHPRFAEATFRHACGLTPLPASEPVRNWLQSLSGTFAPVLGIDLSDRACVVFDLGVGSPLASADPRDREAALTRHLLNAMQSAGVRVGVGQYDEAHLPYETPDSVSGDVQADERRTVHLGVDLFADAGTAVFAPLAGTVHAFTGDTLSHDHGPVIILQHRTDDGHTFFTLYGRLSGASLEGVRVGRNVARAQQLATIGSPAENGGRTPHLHFQLISDLLDLDRDFPASCRPSRREVWTDFSLDPNLILRIPSSRFTPRETNTAQTLATRRKFMGQNLSVAYTKPIKVVRGWIQYLYDQQGRKYLDAYNNVPHVGHCHPRVVQAGQEQMSVLNTNTRYLHDLLNRYAERLTATMPPLLSVCFFVNSGSEANELALRLARAHTGEQDTIVLEGAYHGHTNTLIDISPYKHDGPGGSGAPAWVHTAPVADVYRGPYKSDDPHAGEEYAQHVLGIIERLRAKRVGLAAYITESCPSVGGQIIFPDGYLAAAYRHVRAAGGVCIADEVQTGYGRLGTHFYGFDAQGIVPDIVVLGKPIGNGHPIGAVVTTPEIAASFDSGMEFFSTFGGNTVSCAIGLAVLDVVRDENLQEHALHVGDHLLDRLRALKDRYPIVGDVRGKGLFIGVELVRDGDTLEPAGEEAAFICNCMRERGVLLGTDGPYHNVIKIRPPMPFCERDADFLIAAMDRVLADDFS